MRFSILSLFPGYFTSALNESMIKLAQKKGSVEVALVDIRDFAEGKHRQVDDRPYGGGPGMVMMPGPVLSAVRAVKEKGSHVVYLTPQGTPFTDKKARELAHCEHLILLCGHYEGIDERAIQSCVDEEISIGDYVLTSGCPAALVVLESVMRFIPGVLGHDESAQQDSFAQGLLDHPHYTRPEMFEEESVPSVLLSGNHAQIEKWRKTKAVEKTKIVRPDIYEKYEIADKS